MGAADVKSVFFDDIAPSLGGRDRGSGRDLFYSQTGLELRRALVKYAKDKGPVPILRCVPGKIDHATGEEETTMSMIRHAIHVCIAANFTEGVNEPAFCVRPHLAWDVNLETRWVEMDLFPL